MDISKKDLRRARVLAMQVLYSYEKNEGASIEQVFKSVSDLPEIGIANNDAITFSKNLILKFREAQSEIDALLTKNMKNWTLERISAIDRAILRLAITELLMKITPLRVVISEAVDIAKDFGTDDSGKFINGVLDGSKKDIDYIE